MEEEKKQPGVWKENMNGPEIYEWAYHHYSKVFRAYSEKELIDTFNEQGDIKAYGYGRMGVLVALQEEMRRRYDVTAIAKNGTFSYANKIIIIDKKVVLSTLTTPNNRN